MRIDATMTGKRHQTHLALMGVLMIATFVPMICQLGYPYIGHLYPAMVSGVTGGELDLLAEDDDSQRIYGHKVDEARIAAIIATAASLLLLPIYIAWTAKSTRLGPKSKVAWIIAFVLFNTLAMMLFLVLALRRIVLRMPPRPLKRRQIARAEKFLAQNNVARESLTERQFQFIGRRLALRRACRQAGLFMALVTLALGAVLFLLFQNIAPRIDGMLYDSPITMESLAEECECEQIDKKVDGLSDGDYFFVSRKIMKTYYGLQSLMAMWFAVKTALFASMAIYLIASAGSETRVIAEFLYALEEEETLEQADE